MIIDGHLHVGSWDYKYYSSLFVDVKRLNKVLDACGMAGAIIIPSDQKDNDRVLQDIIAHGKKDYWFFAWCDPRDKKCRNFLTKNQKRVSGLKFHSSLDRVRGGVTNKLYLPFLDFAQACEIPVSVHCGRWQAFASYKFVFTMAKKYKKLKFIMAHMGGDSEALKIESVRLLKKEKIDNVWVDISATREFWTIAQAIKEIGCERFIFGSDFPVMHPKMSIASVDVLNINVAQKKKIFSENLLKLLGRQSLTKTESARQ